MVQAHALRCEIYLCSSGVARSDRGYRETGLEDCSRSGNIDNKCLGEECGFIGSTQFETRAAAKSTIGRKSVDLDSSHDPADRASGAGTIRLEFPAQRRKYPEQLSKDHVDGSTVVIVEGSSV